MTDPSSTDGGSSHGIGWGDYDNDGWLDLVVAHHHGQDNLLCRNNGNGTFTKITNSPIANDGGDSYSCIWGDYNNDGYIDLFVSNVAGTNWLYKNDGGVFYRVTNVFTEAVDSTASAWSDYDNDGYLDLFVANYRGRSNTLHRGHGDGTFTQVSSAIVADNEPGSAGCVWGDYDNDGWQDLFVVNPFSASKLNLLYHNNGDGTFTRITNGVVVTEPANSYGCVWADYDNDGFLDLFVANNGAKNFLYRNNQNGEFTKITSGDIVNDVANFYNGCWGDYDNDGWLDLFVANFSGNNFLYRNNGNGTFTKVTTGVLVTDGGNSPGCAWADMDNDGALDLYITNHGGNNCLYRNNGNTNAWVIIKLIGTASNRSGIGAKVRLRATINGTNRWQFREISGGNSVTGGSLNAHFGLGDAASIDALRIEWPSGIVQQLNELPARTIMTVIEPTTQTLVSKTNNGSAHLTLISRKGAHLQVDASENLTNWILLTSLTNSAGKIEVEDFSVTNSIKRFYRVTPF